MPENPSQQPEQREMREFTWDELDPEDLCFDLRKADRRSGDRVDLYYEQVAKTVVRATMPGARPAPGKPLPTLAMTSEDAAARERYHKAKDQTHGTPRPARKYGPVVPTRRAENHRKGH